MELQASGKINTIWKKDSKGSSMVNVNIFCNNKKQQLLQEQIKHTL